VPSLWHAPNECAVNLPEGYNSRPNSERSTAPITLSQISQAIDRVARHALAATLKADGYLKRARTWRRVSTSGAILVVNVQASTTNVDREGRCTLNAGVYFRALSEVLGIGALTDSPIEAECHLRVRPAMLATNRDVWWDLVAGNAESEAIASDNLRSAYEHHGREWLTSMQELPAARAALERSGLTWWASAASVVLGEREEASRLLRLACERSAERKEWLSRWGHAHGLS
jgi:hypothetical protein